MTLVQAGLAWIEGVGLAFSPCILPILPLVLASSTTGNRFRPLCIVLGFIFSFSFFSLLSRQLLVATGVQLDQIQTVAFVLLLLLGLVMLLPVLDEWFSRLTSSMASQAQTWSTRQGITSGLWVGALIGIIWTPCAGPILAVALLQVIQSQTNLDAVITILAFSIGVGIPMLLVGYGGQFLVRHITQLSRHTVLIRRLMGALVVVVALMGLSGFNIGVWAVSPSTTVSEFSTGLSLEHGLRVPYPAPELAGITQWFNSKPLTLNELKGKVILIDFWTYSCINCIRTLPYLEKWYQTYQSKGLVVIGVHTPEFAFEAQEQNVKRAVEKFGLTYPVAMDNRFLTWNHFNNRYWPAQYLIDRTGQIVYTHFGEGDDAIIENNIRYLLKLGKEIRSQEAEHQMFWKLTPETYLGSARADKASQAPIAALPLHRWRIIGKWVQTREYIESASAHAELTLHYQAKQVFLVMESADGKPKEIVVTNGNKQTKMIVQHAELYEIVNGESIRDGLVSVRAEEPGVRLFSFTFGG